MATHRKRRPSFQAHVNELPGNQDNGSADTIENCPRPGGDKRSEDVEDAQEVAVDQSKAVTSMVDHLAT
jgi:hypothetical protein